ncbi:RNA-dependent DNA polymerase [Pseudoscourfieldia marina]
MAWITRDIRPGGSVPDITNTTAIYSARGFYFGQIDVETAYLYALVQELIYMRPPKGTNYGPNKICRLLKSLYGLKQWRNWYLDLKDYLVELGFKPGEVDIGMYSAAVGTENEIWILVYVDDIIFASKNEQTKDIFAGHLRKKYRITEPAQLTWALGMKVSFAQMASSSLKIFTSSDTRRKPGDNHENRRSTSGYIFFLNGGPISWASYLQTTVALSTVESEVMALTEAIKEAIYIRRLRSHLARARRPNYHLHGFNRAEALVDHPTSHRRTKHIEIRREFIKFHIGHETVKIERVSTKDQLADIDEASRQDIHNYLVQMIPHG